MRVLRYVPFLLLVALGVATPAAASGGGPRVSVVATGLDSPRHLAFGSRGDLFVAEAGRGGSGPCFIGGEDLVHGRERRGDEDRPLGPSVPRSPKGLASMANTPGNDSAIGPHGIMVARRDNVDHHQRRPDGAAGQDGPPASRSCARRWRRRTPSPTCSASVLLIGPRGRPIRLADI